MRLPLLLLAMLPACAGPDAPDAAVCRDAIDRVCLARSCEDVATRLALSPDVALEACVTTLTARAGCERDDFVFEQVDRETFLGCRERLLTAGTTTRSAPSCEDAESFLTCPGADGLFRAVRP